VTESHLLQFSHWRNQIDVDFSDSFLYLHTSVGIFRIKMGVFLTDILILPKTNKI